MFGANTFGIACFGQAGPLVAELPLELPPSPLIGGGSAPNRRHGLTRAVPRRIPQVIRATAHLVQAAHECEAIVSVTLPTVSARAELLQTAGQCSGVARITIRGNAALAHAHMRAQGLAIENTDKLDEEYALAAAALLCLSEEEEAAELCCK